MADLIEQGYRLVYRIGSIFWVHPLELRSDDIDVSDLNDDQFEQFVREQMTT